MSSEPDCADAQSHNGSSEASSHEPVNPEGTSREHHSTREIKRWHPRSSAQRSPGDSDLADSDLPEAGGLARSATVRGTESSDSRGGAKGSVARPAGVAAAVRGITDRERMLGFVAAAVAAALWCVLTIPGLVHPPKHLQRGQPDTTQVAIYLAVGLVLAALIFASAIVRRRALLGFAVLFTGASFGGIVFLALPFWALGGWLLWRAFTIQRAAAASTAAARGPASAGRAGRSARSARSGAAATERKPPPPSKRYTPPKPVARKPRPPSSTGNPRS